MLVNSYNAVFLRVAKNILKSPEGLESDLIYKERVNVRWTNKMQYAFELEQQNIDSWELVVKFSLFISYIQPVFIMARGRKGLSLLLAVAILNGFAVPATDGYREPGVELFPVISGLVEALKPGNVAEDVKFLVYNDQR